jgi:hypothetical protein
MTFKEIESAVRETIDPRFIRKLLYQDSSGSFISRIGHSIDSIQTFTILIQLKNLSRGIRKRLMVWLRDAIVVGDGMNMIIPDDGISLTSTGALDG